MTKLENEEPPENHAGKSIWNRLKSLLRLRNAPDTTEELESEIQDLLEEGEEQL